MSQFYTWSEYIVTEEGIVRENLSRGSCLGVSQCGYDGAQMHFTHDLMEGLICVPCLSDIREFGCLIKTTGDIRVALRRPNDQSRRLEQRSTKAQEDNTRISRISTKTSPMQKVTLFQSRNGEGFEFTECGDDVILPTTFFSTDPETRMTGIKNLPFTDSVLVATYPKCGTHWVANMVLRLKKKDDDISRWGFLELTPLDVLEKSARSGEVFTTHLHPGRLPDVNKTSNLKVALILRNPKDVAVSFYHHFKKMAVITNKQDWDEFLESFMDGKVPWGSMSKYLHAWEKEIEENKEREIAVFYYEDFIVDCVGTLKKLANFIGAEKSDEELASIVGECSLDNLRTAANKTTDKGPRDKEGKSVVYRKGDIGDWKNHFTVGQSERFDVYLKENFPESRFTFKYST